jgi:RNA polymerase sigma-70 factor (ECF subfamily)
MDPGINPMKVLSHKQLSKDIQKSLKSLPEKQRTVFQLKVLDGMTIREIAEVLGAAEGTVKSHLFRATRFLREDLKGWAQP